MTNDQRKRDVSRRGLLKGTAALAGTAMAGSAGAYRDEIDFPLPAVQNDVGGRTISLLGIVGGWIGVAPAEYDGVSNPPLRLIEGEENEIIWTNGDGHRHNFAVANEEGEIIESTEFLEEQSASTSITITPEEEMAQYYCVPHPVQMRGPIEMIDPDEIHELRVRVEDEDGNPLGAEVFVGDHHSFSDIVGRPDPAEDEDQSGQGQEPGGENGNETSTGGTGNETTVNGTGNETSTGGTGNETTGSGVEEEEAPAAEDAPAIARFDTLEEGEYDVEVWTYGHERVTDTVTLEGDDKEITVTLPAIDPGEPSETFSFALENGQWIGQSPDAIADQTNPTLELEAGESYAVEWENTLGRLKPQGENRHYEPLPGHNFVIASGGDTNKWTTYVRSDFTDSQGATQTVEFVANEDMGVYLDQAQLDAIGEINVSGSAGETGALEGGMTGTDGNESATVDGNESATVDGNESATVDGNESATVDGNESATVDGNESATVDGNESATVDGNESNGD